MIRTWRRDGTEVWTGGALRVRRRVGIECWKVAVADVEAWRREDLKVQVNEGRCASKVHGSVGLVRH